MSDAARDLLRRMLQKDPDRRVTIVEALAHPWLTRQSLEDKPLERTVVQRLQRFATLGHLKQVVLSLIVDEVIAENSLVTSPALAMVDKVKELFSKLDTDQSGEPSCPAAWRAGGGMQGVVRAAAHEPPRLSRGPVLR